MLGHLTVLAINTPTPAPFVFGVALGFVVGAFGHIVKSTPLICLGIAILVLTSLAWIIASDPTATG